MTITQTYYLAHTARRKLTHEASRADHNLRILVGHANLLDSLMDDLASAEQSHDIWPNQSVSVDTAAKNQHIQWAKAIVDDSEDWEQEDMSDYSDSSDDDLDDDLDEESYKMTGSLPVPVPVPIPTPLYRPAPEQLTKITEEEVDADLSDSDSDLEELTLTRSVARDSPPELLTDSDGESEEDTTPPSPSQPTLRVFDEKEINTTTTEIPLSDSRQIGLLEQEYYFSHRPQGALIQSY